MGPRLAAFLLLLVLGAPGPARGQAAGAASDPAIVVGVVATLSGPGALAGQDVLDGFQLALRHLGGRFANQEVRLAVVDDGGSPDQARQSVAKIQARERLDMVLTAVSPASLATIVKPLTAGRLFVINLDTAPSFLSGADCSQWLFDLAGQVDGVHEAAGLHFTAEHLRRVAVVGPDSPLTDEAVAALRRVFPGEVAAVLKPRHGATTFAGEIQRLRELAPDAVYSILTGGVAGAFARAYQLSGLKPDIPLVALWRAFERPMLAAMGEGALDVTTIAPWSPDLDAPLNKRMINDFEFEHGRSATGWVAQGYDAALLLDGALRATQGRTHDAEALRAALRRAEFTSVRGAFKFNTNQFPLSNLYLRRTVRDAKGRITHETRGLVLKDWRDRNAPACPMRWAEAVPSVMPSGKKP